MAKSPKSDPAKDPEFQKVVQHFLKTPPKPHAPAHGESMPEHFFVFLSGRCLVASGKSAPGPTFKTNLYRNLDDLRAGKIMESGVTLSRA